MWDIRGIGQPWDLAIETGMLSLTTTKVRPGPTGSVFESDDPVAQVHLGRSIVNLLLLHALSRSPSVENARPQISAIMLPLFALLCRPEGQDLGYLREIDGRLARALRAGDAAERSAALQCSAVLRELRALGSVRPADRRRRHRPGALRPSTRRGRVDQRSRERRWPSTTTPRPFPSSPTSERPVPRFGSGCL